MAKSKKPESSRLNLFYILQILSSHSDEEHPMSAPEIRDKVNERVPRRQRNTMNGNGENDAGTGRSGRCQKTGA